MRDLYRVHEDGRMSAGPLGVAIHEAGHAVVALALGHTLTPGELIWVRSDERDRWGGYTPTRLFGTIENLPDIAPIDSAICQGGAHAEGRALPFVDLMKGCEGLIRAGAESDTERASRHVLTGELLEPDVVRRAYSISWQAIVANFPAVARLGHALAENGELVAKHAIDIIGRVRRVAVT
jgi:hypothetical protein